MNESKDTSRIFRESQFIVINSIKLNMKWIMWLSLRDGWFLIWPNVPY